MLRTRFLLASFMLTVACCSESFAQQVVEIPRPFLLGYAKATYVRGQPVIYYNPRAIRRTGLVGPFIRAHEYAHFNLGHFRRPISARRAELEADILAARMVSPSSAMATQRWFARGNGGGPIHGTSIQRARRVNYGFAGRPR